MVGIAVLLWSIGDTLGEIRDRLPEPPPTPSVVKHDE